MARLSVQETADGVAIDVKVVPNAKSDAVAGLLGEALKVRVAAAPEAGKANKAVCRLLAERLQVDRRRVSVAAGSTSARKRIAIIGLDAAAVHAKLGETSG